MRILITGSRDWADADFIKEKLILATENAVGEIILVSGHCPTGADFMAEQVAKSLGWKIEAHSADWAMYGKRAGFVRNDQMVKLGAEVCLAFIRDGSKGATMCATLAEKAGIRTIRFEKKSNELD